MSLEQFMNEAISPWLRDEGPENDIVLSSRIRLARNFQDHIFPTVGEIQELSQITDFFQKEFQSTSFQEYKVFDLISMSDLSHIEMSVLVGKYLISAYLVRANWGAAVMSAKEHVSIMITEEDHMRIRLYYRGFQ